MRSMRHLEIAERCVEPEICCTFLTVISVLGSGSNLRQVYSEAYSSPVTSQADSTSHESAWKISVSSETVSSNKSSEAEANSARGFFNRHLGWHQ